MKNPVIWGIHMPREHGLNPIEQAFVAIGWDAMGDLSAIKPTRDAFKAAYGETYPDEKILPRYQCLPVSRTDLQWK